MVKVRYKGRFDEVEIIDGQVEKTCEHGEAVEVSEALAHGRDAVGEPGDDDFVSALGGLLEQTDNWELADDADEYPAAGSVKSVLAWVGEDTERAEYAAGIEGAAEKPRPTLIEQLEAVLAARAENKDGEQ